MAEKEYIGKVLKYKYVPERNGKRGMGYGFIQCLETGEEFFVYRDAIQIQPETTLDPRLYNFEKVAFTVDENSEHNQMQQRDLKNGKTPLRKVKSVYGIFGSVLRVDDESNLKKLKEEKLRNKKTTTPTEVPNESS